MYNLQIADSETAERMLRGGPPVCSVHHVDEINEEEASEWEPETPPHHPNPTQTQNNQSSDKLFS